MKNAGYTILQHEMYDFRNGYGVAIGFNGQTYVTWETKLTDGEMSYFWGHYRMNTFDAWANYHGRLLEKYRELREELKQNERK